MKFTITKTSDWYFEKEIEINTLSDLEFLQKRYGSELIVDFKKKLIEIYDDYRE